MAVRKNEKPKVVVIHRFLFHYRAGLFEMMARSGEFDYDVLEAAHAEALPRRPAIRQRWGVQDEEILLMFSEAFIERHSGGDLTVPEMWLLLGMIMGHRLRADPDHLLQENSRGKRTSSASVSLSRWNRELMYDPAAPRSRVLTHHRVSDKDPPYSQGCLKIREMGFGTSSF